jgi:hypothetical protein
MRDYRLVSLRLTLGTILRSQKTHTAIFLRSHNPLSRTEIPPSFGPKHSALFYLHWDPWFVPRKIHKASFFALIQIPVMDPNFHLGLTLRPILLLCRTHTATCLGSTQLLILGPTHSHPAQYAGIVIFLSLRDRPSSKFCRVNKECSSTCWQLRPNFTSRWEITDWCKVTPFFPSRQEGTPLGNVLRRFSQASSWCI